MLCIWTVRVSAALLQSLCLKQVGWNPQQAFPHAALSAGFASSYPAEQVPTLLQWIFMQIYATAQAYLIQNLKLLLQVYLPQYSFSDGKKHGYYSPLPKFTSVIFRVKIGPLQKKYWLLPAVALICTFLYEMVFVVSSSHGVKGQIPVK